MYRTRVVLFLLLAFILSGLVIVLLNRHKYENGDARPTFHHNYQFQKV